MRANELEQVVAERTKELRRSNDDLQQFAHVASHDLKEPVRKTGIFSDRLRTQHQTKWSHMLMEIKPLLCLDRSINHFF
jgi:light-regulated signal transduction histidine kinase (bacteriophytochrome)